jgi:hypothetical protein
MKPLFVFFGLLFLVSCSSVNVANTSGTDIVFRERFDRSQLSDKSEMTVVRDSIAVVSNKGRR